MSQKHPANTAEENIESTNPSLNDINRYLSDGLLKLQPIRYKKKEAKALGIVQMVIGIICLVFNACLIGTHSGDFNIHEFGYGIWSGSIFFVAGLISLISGSMKQPSKCLIISTMVMDIIAACFASCVTICGILDAALAKGYKDKEMSYYFSSYTYYSGSTQKSLDLKIAFYNTTTALALVMVLLSILEAVISITGSAFCCRAVCCTGTTIIIQAKDGAPSFHQKTQQSLYVTINNDATSPADFGNEMKTNGCNNYASQPVLESQTHISKEPELPHAYEKLRL